MRNAFFIYYDCNNKPELEVRSVKIKFAYLIHHTHKHAQCHYPTNLQKTMMVKTTIFKGFRVRYADSKITFKNSYEISCLQV